jgi:hypothetical protein
MKFILVATPLSTNGSIRVETMYADWDREEELATMLARKYPESIYFFVETWEDRLPFEIDECHTVLTRRRLWRYNQLDPKASYAEYGWPHDIYYDIRSASYMVIDFPEEGKHWIFDRPIPDNMDDFIVDLDEEYQVAKDVFRTQVRVRMEK